MHSCWMMMGDWAPMPMNRRVSRSTADSNRRFMLLQEWEGMRDESYDRLVEDADFVRQALDWPAGSFQRVEIEKALKRKNHYDMIVMDDVEASHPRLDDDALDRIIEKAWGQGLNVGPIDMEKLANSQKYAGQAIELIRPKPRRRGIPLDEVWVDGKIVGHVPRDDDAPQR